MSEASSYQKLQLNLEKFRIESLNPIQLQSKQTHSHFQTLYYPIKIIIFIEYMMTISAQIFVGGNENFQKQNKKTKKQLFDSHF